MLALAIFGVAYTSVAETPLYGYWEFLGVAIGVACVAIGWRQASDRSARFALARTQALHWAAFLVAMNIVLWPSVNSFLNAPATGLALLLLLALGTFVAGIHVSFDIAVLGLAMAVAVPAIAGFQAIGAVPDPGRSRPWRGRRRLRRRGGGEPLRVRLQRPCRVATCGLLGALAIS